MVADRRRFISRERDAAALEHDRVVEKQNALAKLRSQVAKLKRDARRAGTRVRLPFVHVITVCSRVQGKFSEQEDPCTSDRSRGSDRYAPSAGPSRLQNGSHSIRSPSQRRDRDDKSAQGSLVRNLS